MASNTHDYDMQQAMMQRHSGLQQQLDEGFSETRSQEDLTSSMADLGAENLSASDSDMEYTAGAVAVNAKLQQLMEKILSLPADQRKDLAQHLIRSLPNEDKSSFIPYIENLIHFDPSYYLPAEVFLSILGYLSPQDLLTSSQISRPWRARVSDEKLWRGCFRREGWVLDHAKTQEFEKLAQDKGIRAAESTVKGGKGEESAMLMLERKESRKRRRDEAFTGENELGNVQGASERDADGMEGVEATSISPEGTAQSVLPQNSQSTSSSNDTRPSTSDSTTAIPPTSRPDFDSTTSPADFQVSPRPLQTVTNGLEHPKLSWPYLYKHRRRLETNWEQGRYKTFQLPHPQHPNEGHTECVYTIQHTTRHLVSGSRDKTIRIWDLDTQRLKAKPLKGHEASVLCLQFDERPEHDIIVSGGSDAHIIVWKFSTGEIIQMLKQAHDESVLNLRFDDKYIVTCSKDKTIKLWNRHAAARDDTNVIPTHILENFSVPSPINFGGGLDPATIEPFTLLNTLHGHHAAVNAVMIHDSIIVSASGDRSIKSWDIATGSLRKNYVGHTKGIACVQFDGRRIVSGSSDNTVRIFDAEQQAEIACLQGHSNLVRTVQARFGDLDIVSDGELEEEARLADEGFMQAMRDGRVTASGPASAAIARARRRSQRNAGSSRPEEMLSLGTKVPPGGGGSRWAKIVSGSYDESVILWKRDKEGKWCPKLKLTQDVLVRNGQGRRRGGGAQNANAANGGAAATLGAQQVLATAHAQLAQANQLLQPANPGALPNSQLVAMAAAQSSLQQQVVNQQQHAQAQNAARAATQQGDAAQNQAAAIQQAHQGAHAVAHSLVQVAAQQAAAGHGASLPQTQTNASATAHQQQQTITSTFQPSTNAALAQLPAIQPAVPATNNAPAQAAAHQHPPGHGPQGQAYQGHPQAPRDSNRVFKLQFDTRRIVCCSQNKVIVGWDFANGDPELERIGEWSLETA